MSTLKSSVHIPRTALGAKLAEAATIKRDLSRLLSELEERAAGHPITGPGTWRHHPDRWPT